MSMMTLPSCVCQCLEILFDLLLPSVLSRLPLSFSHRHIGRSAGDVWHSDICHLLLAPTDALYKLTTRLERSSSLFCAFFHTSYPRGSFWFIFEWGFFLWKVRVSLCRANPVLRIGRVLYSVAQCQSVSDITWQTKEGRGLRIPVTLKTKSDDGMIKCLHHVMGYFIHPCRDIGFFSPLLQGGQSAFLPQNSHQG